MVCLMNQKKHKLCIAELDRECKWRSYQKINTIWHYLKGLKIFLQMVASQLSANEITGIFLIWGVLNGRAFLQLMLHLSDTR